MHTVSIRRVKITVFHASRIRIRAGVRAQGSAALPDGIGMPWHFWGTGMPTSPEAGRREWEWEWPWVYGSATLGGWWSNFESNFQLRGANVGDTPLAPNALTSAAVSASFAASRATSTRVMLAPWLLANPMAMDRPNPRLAPVTIATTVRRHAEAASRAGSGDEREREREREIEGRCRCCGGERSRRRVDGGQDHRSERARVDSE